MIPGLALAGTKGPSVSGAAVEWQADSGYDGVQLVVMAPSGAYFSKVFTAGQAPQFTLKDIAASLAVDGTYTYELRYTPRLSSSVKKAMADAREAGDDAAAAKLLRDNGGAGLVQSGVFTVNGGSFVTPTLAEPQRKPATNTSNPLRGSSDAKLHAAPNDIVDADDVIIQGSLCVGLDCVNNESFGFDTIRLKENNTRIKFDDTSTGTGFPNHDWQLTANDSASGGANKFSIEDITAATVPVTVTGSAPTNSIFVDSTGRVGFRTSTPVLDLHVNTSNTPAMRLEQNNSGGFTAQTWDVAGNEANFFVRDVTGGSRLPFRIRPGAPTSSIDISADGDTGIGTASPAQKLHIFQSIDANSIVLSENSNNTVGANAAFQTKSDVAILSFQSHATARTVSRFGVTLGAWNEMLASAGNGLAIGTLSAKPLILGTNSVNRLIIDGTTGAVTVSGNFTVTGVKNFAMPDPANAEKAIYYASLEGPEAGTYFRGTAKTVNGEAVIDLPGFFSRITEKERMTVQLTPVGAPGQLYIAEKTPEKVVIKVAGENAKDLEFDYFVQGVRKGYLDYQVERVNNLPK
jgi:hypothetical protein